MGIVGGSFDSRFGDILDFPPDELSPDSKEVFDGAGFDIEYFPTPDSRSERSDATSRLPVLHVR